MYSTCGSVEILRAYLVHNVSTISEREERRVWLVISLVTLIDTTEKAGVKNYVSSLGLRYDLQL